MTYKRLYVMVVLAAILGCGGESGPAREPLSIKLGSNVASSDGLDWPRRGSSPSDDCHVDQPGRFRITLQPGRSVEVFSKYTIIHQKNSLIRQVDCLPMAEPGSYADAVKQIAFLGRVLGSTSHPKFVAWHERIRDAEPESGPFDNASCRVPIEDDVNALFEVKHHLDGGWFVVLSFYKMDLFDGS